ncbi:hypothetical protein BH09BAC6_BH09BAC6_01760 [soil metagenome]|jgi:hypothetical protein
MNAAKQHNVQPNHPAKAMAAKPLFFQPKLSINQPNDVYEQEADHMADKVMRMADPSASQNSFFKPAINSVQRKCAACDEEKSIQRKENTNSRGQANDSMGSYVNSLGSSGQLMPESSRKFFEPRFGHDFSNVRLHTDSVAAKSAQSINALAYTTGNNIVFNSGQYSPESESGKKLMAHELTHVVQQGGNAGATIQRKIEVPAGTTLDTLEIESTKSGNVYTCASVVKTSLFYEIYTAMLASPRLFKPAGKTSEQVFQNLKKNIDARMGIVKFASLKKYTFGVGSNFKMNPKYYEWNDKKWSMKKGVNQKEALNDLNAHPEEYRIACEAATKLTMLGGGNSNLVDGPSQDINDWVPGDWGYIENLNFHIKRTPGLEGENIIYVGADKFWGHFNPGNTYDTIDGWISEVDSFDNNTGNAEIEDQRTYPGVGLNK